MRNVALCVIPLAMLLHAGLARADCSRPRPGFQIPDGATATEDELTKAKEALVKYDQQVGEYLRCLEGEASQKSVGKDATARTKLATDYVSTYNSAADELTGLGTCYNAQVKAAQTAKAKATPAAGAKPAAGAAAPPPAAGTKPTAKKADCTTFIKEAGARKTNAGEPVLENGIVREADGYTTDLTDGAWSFTLLRDERLRRCTQAECQQRIVYIRNSSPRSLECKATITYEGTDVENRATVEGKAVIAGKTGRPVLASLAAKGVNAKTFDAQCNPRPELAPLATPATCKYEVIKPVTIGDYYPDASRKAGEEGPVTVEFNVGDKAASPSDVKVVASSLFPALDQGAVNAVQAMVMSSNCKTGRYRLRLSFQLQ